MRRLDPCLWDTSGRLPGRVMLGAYSDTGQFDRLDGSGRMGRGVGSVYGIARQKLWEPEPLSDRGIHVWTALTHAWNEAWATFPWYVNGGLVWFGPLQSRQSDNLALGFANAWFSNALPGQSCPRNPCSPRRTRFISTTFWRSHRMCSTSLSPAA